jgi:hypothetical protein
MQNYLAISKIFRTFASRNNKTIMIMAKTNKVQNRPLCEIARDIRKDWGSKVYFGAKPYLDAMATLDSINDNYGWDSADSIVRYFLANASTWRGETAKAIKKELKAMVGLK